MSEEFIYNALKTKSPEWFGKEVDVRAFKDVLAVFIHTGNRLDAYKKKLFYNKDSKDVNWFPTGVNLDYDLTQQQIDVIHAITGLATEGVELVEALQKFLEVGVFDVPNLKEEAGDIFWYMAILANAAGFTFEEIQDTVIAKLKHRYPDKFTIESAINRDLEGERKILES